MEYVDLQQEQDRLEFAGDLQRLSVLTELLRAFPDLKAVRDRWDVIRYCSPSANAEADSLEWLPSVPSSDSQGLEAWPYVTIDKAGTKLYADPPCYIIADENQQGFGITTRPGWRELLESFALSRSVILKVKDHLDRHPPISYFD